MFQLILLCLLKTSNSYANSIIELADDRYLNDYKLYLTENPNFKSAKQSAIQSEMNRSSKIIASKFKLAEGGLLEANLKPSIQLFKDIIHFYKTSIFDLKSRSLISKSFLHLATLEKEKRIFWTKQAAVFNPDYKPSPVTFNPLVMSSFNNHASLTKRQNRVNTSLTPDSLVFINGRPAKDSYPINKNYYVTIYKDGFYKKKATLNPHQLKSINNLSLNKKNLGSCSNPIFSEQISKIYFNPFCVKSKTDHLFNQSTQVVSKQTFNPTNQDFNLLVKSTAKKPLFKRKSTWITIGVSFLATSAIIFINDQNKKTSFKPVHRVSSH